MLIRIAMVIAAAWAVFAYLVIWGDGGLAEAQVAFLPGIALIALAYAVQWAVAGRR